MKVIFLMFSYQLKALSLQTSSMRSCPLNHIKKVKQFDNINKMYCHKKVTASEVNLRQIDSVENVKKENALELLVYIHSSSPRKYSNN